MSEHFFKGVKVNEDGSFDLSGVSSGGGRYKEYERLRHLTDEDLQMDVPWEDKRYEDIKTRAWLKWQEAGCPEGDGVEFWLAAEKEYNENSPGKDLSEKLDKLNLYVPPAIQVEWGEPPVIKCDNCFGPLEGKGEPEQEFSTHISSVQPSPLDPKEVSEVLPPWCGTSYPTEDVVIIAPPKQKCCEGGKCDKKEKKPQNPQPPLPAKEERLPWRERVRQWWAGLLRGR